MFDKFFTILLTVLIITGVVIAVTLTVMQTNVCEKACDSDPVARCYKDRAMCVGADKVYVKKIP